ncbi:hypothetical protein Dsin_027809 [Dipteronia sinensis]|uniref:Uncharacterized protein n=1 Tax=Dipteronia sinensis TaxID=43782 RepID=A0AAD9ZP55_9ROSI|nr:hypothetical protein Dsin_027809 [Dipteronia sinensis]
MTSRPPPAPTPVTRSKAETQISSSIIIAIIAPITITVALSIASYCFLTRRARKKYGSISHQKPLISVYNKNLSFSYAAVAGNDITDVEALQLDFGTIQAATNGFSTNNKLGEGGFGQVYKV